MKKDSAKTPNYSLEIAILLTESAQARSDFGRVCKVAFAVARTEDDYVSYVWAYLSGNRDWKSLEEKIP